MKKIISLLLAFLTCFSVAVPALAANEKPECVIIENATTKTETGLICGSISFSINSDSVFPAKMTVNYHGTNNLEIPGYLMAYPDGAFAGDKVLFVAASTNIEKPIVIERESLQLNTRLSETSNISVALSAEQFDAIYQLALSNYNYGLENGDFKRQEYLSQLFSYDIGFESYSVEPSFMSASSQPSFNSVQTLFNSLKSAGTGANGWISISKFNGISESFFDTNEFIAFNMASNTKSRYICAKSTQYTTGFYYTRIGVLHITYDSDANANSVDHYLQSRIYDGIMFQYNPNTKMVRLVAENFSPIFYNITPTIGMTSGNINNYFTSVERSGQVNRPSFDVVNMLTALPEGGWIATLYASLKAYKTEPFNSGIFLFGDKNEQKSNYGGVVREVGFNSQKVYLMDVGDYMVLSAKENYVSNRSSINYSVRATASLNTSF